MPIRRRRLVLALVLAVTSPLAACDRWALSVNGDGLLFISIINDGDGQGGFRVRTRDADGASRIIEMPPSGNLPLGDFAAGRLELTLLPPEGCSVAAPNPRTLIVNANQPITVAFEVHCRFESRS